MSEHGRINLDAAIPRMRYAPDSGETVTAYMTRVAAATAFAYAMPAAQFARQPGFSYEVEALTLPAGTIAHGKVRGQVRQIRDAALVAATRVDALFVYVIVGGSMTLRPDRGAGPFGAGDIVIHDLAEPADILLDDYELLLLVIGRSALPAELHRRPLNGAVVRHSHPLAPLVTSLVAGICNGAARLRPAHADTAFAAALALLGAALAEVTLAGHIPVPVRAAAETVIDTALDEPGLDPATIAARLGVSRATLYRAFRTDGGVRRVIAHRRLHHAWTMCSARPAPAPATVARACGYASVARLDEALRAAFELTAREIASLPDDRLNALASGTTRIMADIWSRVTRSG